MESQNEKGGLMAAFVIFVDISGKRGRVARDAGEHPESIRLRRPSSRLFHFETPSGIRPDTNLNGKLVGWNRSESLIHAAYSAHICSKVEFLARRIPRV